MAQGAASSWRFLAHTPGNPQLPALPGPGDPIEGVISPLADGAGVTARRATINYLELHAAGPGTARGFARTWLNQVGAFPDPVDFGNITATKQRTVTIHNTNRYAITVNSLDLSAVSGVTLVSPGLPVVIGAFSSQVFTVEAGLQGATDFDALAVFSTTEGAVTVRMIGRRVIIFNTHPQRGTIERMTWLSDIMDSDDGTEQAMAARHAPRSAITYNLRHRDNLERTRLQNLQLGAMQLPVGVQLWFQSRELTSAALAADLVLQCSTASMEIENGGSLSLILPDRSSVEVEVASFDATTITLTQEVGTDLPAGTTVAPIKFGFQRTKSALASFATAVEDQSVTFDLIDYAADPFVDPAYFEAHPVDGLPITLTPLYFSGQSRKGSIVSDTERLDGNTGAIDQTRTQALSRPAQEVLVHCNSLADQHAWRRFLHAMRGSWGKWYVPTGTNDLPLFADFALGGSTFDVPAMGLASLVGNIAPRRDVKITIAGVDYHRRITNVQDNGAFETVTINAAIPGSGNVPASQFFCSWLTLARIIGDSASFNHQRRGVAELRFMVRGVIDGV